MKLLAFAILMTLVQDTNPLVGTSWRRSVYFIDFMQDSSFLPDLASWGKFKGHSPEKDEYSGTYFVDGDSVFLYEELFKPSGAEFHFLIKQDTLRLIWNSEQSYKEPDYFYIKVKK